MKGLNENPSRKKTQHSYQVLNKPEFYFQLVSYQTPIDTIHFNIQGSYYLVISP